MDRTLLLLCALGAVPGLLGYCFCAWQRHRIIKKRTPVIGYDAAVMEADEANAKLALEFMESGASRRSLP